VFSLFSDVEFRLKSVAISSMF